MTTINLYQNQEDIQLKRANRAANSGFWFSLGILILTLLAMYGLRFYVSSVKAKNVTLAAEATEMNKNLSGVASLQKVLDMQTRLQVINKNLKIENDKVNQLKINEVLDNVAKELNSGITISSFDYSEKDNKVTLSFTSSNFNDSARQIYNFKNSKNFSKVVLSDIARTEKDIQSKVEMNVVTSKTNNAK